MSGNDHGRIVIGINTDDTKITISFSTQNWLILFFSQNKEHESNRCYETGDSQG